MKPVLALSFTAGSLMPVLALYSFSGLPSLVTLFLALLIMVMIINKAARGSGASPSTFSIMAVSAVLLFSSGLIPAFTGIALTYITGPGLLATGEALVAAAFAVPAERAYEVYFNYERELREKGYDMEEVMEEMDSMSRFVLALSGLSSAVPAVLVFVMSRVEVHSGLLVYFLVAFLLVYVLSIRMSFRHLFGRRSAKKSPAP